MNRKSWSAPDGKTRKVEPTRTARANATPRLGQGTKTPFARWKSDQARKRSSFSKGYSYGRPRPSAK